VLLGGKIYGVAGILFAIPAAAIIATVVGKSIKRYLLPMYEREGWWREPIVDGDPVMPPASSPAERPMTSKLRSPVSTVEPAPRVKEPS
jgi:hypothetical protein